jgi:Fe(3+) dicitrate transport protein
LFAENIIYLSERLSITPGIRYEYIATHAEGFYGTIQFDLAGNIISATRIQESRNNNRKFVLGGVGVSFKSTDHIELYGNFSQNYRSITFSDMRITNPSQVIDGNLQDEKGYSLDLGIRSYETRNMSVDMSAFYLNYNNRIGEVQFYDVNNRVMRLRTNIGSAVMMGVETYIEGDVLKLVRTKSDANSIVLFGNFAYIHSAYTSSEINGIEGNEVEFVPNVNIKSGVRFGHKNLKLSFQVSHLSQQFTEATNAVDGGVSAVVGIIPAYTVMDASLSYLYKKWKIELSSNNLGNQMYFTRRATGYPGPGIIPSDARSFFVTLSFRI